MRRSLILFLSILFVATTLSAKSPQKDNDAMTQLRKFNQFYSYLNGSYVEEIDMAPLVEKAIVEMLLELDPHSAYIDAEEMKSVNESFEGEFSGIGVEFNILKDTVIVVNTIVGAPAESVGVMPNDRIIAVDGESVIGITQAKVPTYLRGVRGSKVAIEVVRHGEDGTLDFIIERDNIPINTVDAAYMLNDTVGYIKVNRFGQTTFSEFYDAYRELAPLETLVLDLRGNGGGLLGQAIDLANFFLPRGALIVSTEGRHEEPTVINAYSEGQYQGGNVVVMIDEDSASASEIVAGALQDWDRAVILGRPSFGKGLVQRQFQLLDGSTARITVARYHTPTGRVIQRPYTEGDKDSYYERHIARYSNEDSVVMDSVADRPVYHTLRLGREVYGGGGIMPDIIVERDTTTISPYYISLIRKSVVNEFVIDYLDHHRAELIARYPTFKSFNNGFEVSDEQLSELMVLGDRRSVEREEYTIDDFRDVAQVNIKALFAQKLFTTAEFYKVVNYHNDNFFKELNTLLENWDSKEVEIFGL
ncbi:MAG: S41 family peptidase [Rikenellaceae bacterium]